MIFQKFSIFVIFLLVASNFSKMTISRNKLRTSILMIPIPTNVNKWRWMVYSESIFDNEIPSREPPPDARPTPGGRRGRRRTASLSDLICVKIWKKETLCYRIREFFI